MENITKILIKFCEDKPEFEEICACLRGDSSNLPPGTYMCDPDAYNRLVNRFSEELIKSPEEMIPMVISAFALMNPESEITNILNKYIQSWSWKIDNKTIYVPYHMNTKERTENRNKDENKEEWNKILEHIKFYENEWIINPNMPKKENQFYSDTDSDGDITGGKGSFAMIKFVMEFLVNDNTISVDKLQDIMNNYGIGIDCSGFVSRGLATVFDNLGIPINDQINSLGEKKSGKLKTNATTLAFQDNIIDYNNYDYEENTGQESRIKKKGIINKEFYPILKKKGKLGKNHIIENLKNIRAGDVIVSVKVSERSQKKMNKNGDTDFYMGTEKNSNGKDITYYTLNDKDWNNKDKRIQFYYHIRIIYEVKRDKDGNMLSFSYAESTSTKFDKIIDGKTVKGVTGVKITENQKEINANYIIVRPYALEKFFNNNVSK